MLPHNNVEKICHDLLNQSQKFDKAINAQRYAFRGIDETSNSRNRASYNDKVPKVVLENALRNAKYTSYMIQKEILHIPANKVYIDEKGFIKERFFDLVHVQDTTAITLKEEISQGYNGASNMWGEWNGFQALFLNDCPYTFSQELEIANMLEIDELETGKGLNQISTVKQAGETHWSSHFSSIYGLIRMFNTTCSVLENIIENAATYKKITSFDFIFILHLVKEIMDIVNAMYLASSTKTLIQKLREDGWDNLLEVVKVFCKKHNIEVLDMDFPYVVKCEHHYQVEIFNATIDSQLFELNSRFNEQAIYLLTLSSTLDLKDVYKSFNMDDICFIKEKVILKYQLQHYKQNINSSSVDSSVSTATIERAFSAMKIVKTRLFNKLKDEFLIDNLVVYFKRDIAKTFDSDSIFIDFISLKEHRAQF
ncbi:hypothetical protein V6Z11_A06G122600 [Gossypium hirsutum]